MCRGSQGRRYGLCRLSQRRSHRSAHRSRRSSWVPGATRGLRVSSGSCRGCRSIRRRRRSLVQTNYHMWRSQGSRDCTILYRSCLVCSCRHSSSSYEGIPMLAESEFGLARLTRGIASFHSGSSRLPPAGLPELAVPRPLVDVPTQSLTFPPYTQKPLCLFYFFPPFHTNATTININSVIIDDWTNQKLLFIDVSVCRQSRNTPVVSAIWILHVPRELETVLTRVLKR